MAMGTLAVEVVKLDVAFFKCFIDAFGGDDRYDLVMAVGKAIPLEAFGNVPDNVTLRSFVPQVPLLRDVDLFITHTGANSMHEGLFAGVPLVCIPCFAEQPFNASRVAKLGAGDVLPRGEVSPQRIRETVERVLESASVRAAVDRVRDDLRATRGIDHAAEVITAAASRARYASA
jgi:MGT family glycosyltransferase